MALVALVAMMLVEEEVVVSFMRHIPMVLKEHCIDAPPFPLPPTPAPSPVPLQSPPPPHLCPWLAEVSSHMLQERDDIKSQHTADGAEVGRAFQGRR